MPARRDQNRLQPTAFITHTREYGSAELLANLAQHGYQILERPHDRATEQLVAQLDPDLVILAIDPSRDADIALIRSVARNSLASLLVLGPGPLSHGFGQALEAGADICLRETDGIQLLSPQLGALARRSAPLEDEPEAGPSRIEVRDLVFDFDRCQATRGDQPIPLTPTEFKILGHLAKNVGKVVSAGDIVRAVQASIFSEHEAQDIVKVYVRRIRRKVEADPAAPDYIVNVRGFGYMIDRRSVRRAAA